MPDSYAGPPGHSVDGLPRRPRRIRPVTQVSLAPDLSDLQEAWKLRSPQVKLVAMARIEPASTQLSYISSYTLCMAETITIRTDDDVARALKILTADGTSVSAAVRAAVIKVAHDRGTSNLRAEAQALAGDEVDRAEMAAVLRDMDSLRAW